jgi:hypothetical protein
VHVPIPMQTIPLLSSHPPYCVSSPRIEFDMPASVPRVGTDWAAWAIFGMVACMRESVSAQPDSDATRIPGCRNSRIDVTIEKARRRNIIW